MYIIKWNIIVPIVIITGLKLYSRYNRRAVPHKVPDEISHEVMISKILEELQQLQLIVDNIQQISNGDYGLFMDRYKDLEIKLASIDTNTLSIEEYQQLQSEVDNIESEVDNIQRISNGDYSLFMDRSEKLRIILGSIDVSKLSIEEYQDVRLCFKIVQDINKKLMSFIINKLN